MIATQSECCRRVAARLTGGACALFLSNVCPYWGNETKVRNSDAGTGPLINSAGQYPTAINYQRPVTDQPDPFGDVRKGAPLDRCVRGVGSKLDPIAMQLVEGTDADAALQAGTVTPQRAVHIITHVAKALDFAHAHHVVHSPFHVPV